MENTDYTNKVYAFGPYKLELQDYTLRRNNIVVPLPPKAIETLLLLIDNRDRIVTKNELMQTLWPNTFVEENNLNQHISKIRRALCTELSGNNYIKTIPKRGYKFTAIVNIDIPPPSDISNPLLPHTRMSPLRTFFPKQTFIEDKIVTIALLITLLAIIYKII